MGTSVTKMFMPNNSEEKTNKKNDENARSLLLIALSQMNNNHIQQYNDSEKNCIKCAESLDSIFNMLQKIVSKLAILGRVFFTDKNRTLCQECRAPRSKEGFDRNDMAEEQVQTNMALMAFSDSEPQAVNTARIKAVKTDRTNSAVVNTVKVNQENAGKPQQDDTGFVDSGCSRHMTGNIAYLSDFKEFDGGYVTFGGGAQGGRNSSKETLKTDSLDFKDV
ncbi:hypothetical protein Tco_0488046 [Tanacetum coccineum]